MFHRNSFENTFLIREGMHREHKKGGKVWCELPFKLRLSLSTFLQNPNRLITLNVFISFSFIVTIRLASFVVSFLVLVAMVSAELLVRAQVQVLVAGSVLPLIQAREVCAAICQRENQQKLS